MTLVKGWRTFLRWLSTWLVLVASAREIGTIEGAAPTLQVELIEI